MRQCLCLLWDLDCWDSGGKLSIASKKIFAIFNISKEMRTFSVETLNLTTEQSWIDLIGGVDFIDRRGKVELGPYRFLWIGNQK